MNSGHKTKRKLALDSLKQVAVHRFKLTRGRSKLFTILQLFAPALLCFALCCCRAPATEEVNNGAYDPVAQNWNSELELAQAVVAHWADDSWYIAGTPWTADEEGFLEEIKRNDELYMAFVRIAETSERESHVEAAYYFITKSDRADAIDFLIEKTRASDGFTVLISMHSISMHPSAKSKVDLRSKVVARLKEILSEGPRNLDQMSRARIMYASRLAWAIQAGEVVQLIEAHAKAGEFEQERASEMMEYVESLREID